MKAIRIVAIAVIAVLAIAAVLPTQTTTAAPARRQPTTITQPDGSQITLLLHGDEWFHWNTDLNGTLYLQDEQGYYRPATASQTEAWEAERQAGIAQREAIQAQRKARLQARKSAMTAGSNPDSTVLAPHLSSIPTSGTIHGLVVLTQFQDVKFTAEDPLQHFTDMMMKPGFDYATSATSKYRHIGSVHDFFYQASQGKCDLQFEVFGPITMPEKASYYSSNSDRNAWKMIVEACRQLDDSLDFTRFDNDGDGGVDFVAAIYAGPGSNSEEVSSSQAIWPHQWDIHSASQSDSIYKFDNKKVDLYVCTNETFGGKLDGMGTFCHEFSHLFDFPDLYDPTYNCYSTPGSYDLMDEGAYNLNGYCPAPYSAYERYEMGWINPTILSETGTYSLAPLTTEGQVFMVPVTEGLDDPRNGEYYLFENRQPYAWDAQIPGHGMLIWHIDYSASKWHNNAPNTWANHQCVDLVEADGLHKYGGMYTQDASAPFPGTANHTSFTDSTVPAFCGWKYPKQNISDLSVSLDKAILNITETPIEAELLPEDAKPGVDICNISFDFITNASSISAINTDETAAPSRLVFINGQLIVRTAAGNFDLQGRSL